MGRKVHPIAFRLGINKDWQSRWYADRDYVDLVHEDVSIRKVVGQRLVGASLARIEIQRSAGQIEVTLFTAKPGIVIGKGGQAVDQLRRELETSSGKKVKINIEEIKQPELNAYLIAESIGEQISRRVSYRRALKQAVMRAMRAGAKGVKVRISGRLGGAEMSRSVWEREGRVPLHTIRADIDYGLVHAHTTYGRIGVKVWVYRGDVIEHKGGDLLLQQDRPAAVAQPRPDRMDRQDRTPAARPNRGDRQDRGDGPVGMGGARRNTGMNSGPGTSGSRGTGFERGATGRQGQRSDPAASAQPSSQGDMPNVQAAPQASLEPAPQAEMPTSVNEITTGDSE